MQKYHHNNDHLTFFSSVNESDTESDEEYSQGQGYYFVPTLSNEPTIFDKVEVHMFLSKD